jgi:hypothetical protein
LLGSTPGNLQLPLVRPRPYTSAPTSDSEQPRLVTNADTYFVSMLLLISALNREPGDTVDLCPNGIRRRGSLQEAQIVRCDGWARAARTHQGDDRGSSTVGLPPSRRDLGGQGKTGTKPDHAAHST